MNDQDLRIGDAEREQAAAELGEHYAQGRLTTDEHRERLDQIWAARTRRQLGPVFADLPGRTFPPPTATRLMAPPTAPGRALWRRIPFPLLMLLVAVAAVAVVANLPLIVVGIGAWFLLSRGACGGRMHHRR
ncbi:MAG TPA: DUF1707 domain-containing protein [Nocardioides sp.]|nr:DUF1707 domain-containing protein [Nocardioides sp.]